MRVVLPMRSNHSVNQTPGKLRLPITSNVRAQKMQLQARTVSLVWLCVGVALFALFAMDISKFARDEILLSSSLLGASALAIVIPSSCIYLGIAVWRAMPSARSVGMLLSVLAGSLLVLYVGVNLVLLFKLHLAVSFLAVAIGCAGLWFCVLTYRLVRSISPRPVQSSSEAV